MVKNHMKTIAAPKTWPLHRKSKVYILRPNPGSHNLQNSVSLNFVLVDLLGLAKTKKEAIHIVHSKEVLVEGKRRKQVAMPVGLFDVVTIKDIKKNYRIIIDEKGKIGIIEVDDKDAVLKPSKITGKTKIGKKIQLNLYDGKNVLVEKDDYKVGDTVIVSENKVKEHFKLEKGNTILLIGGSSLGSTGVIEEIEGRKIFYKKKANEVLETLKKYAFVIGKDKPVIKLK